MQTIFDPNFLLDLCRMNGNNEHAKYVRYNSRRTWLVYNDDYEVELKMCIHMHVSMDRICIAVLDPEMDYEPLMQYERMLGSVWCTTDKHNELFHDSED